MNQVSNTIGHAALFLLLIAVVYTFFRYMYIMRYEHFVCPKCNYKFKPKVVTLIFSQNAVNGKIMKCPKCKEKVYLEPVKDNK